MVLALPVLLQTGVLPSVILLGKRHAAVSGPDSSRLRLVSLQQNLNSSTFPSSPLFRSRSAFAFLLPETNAPRPPSSLAFTHSCCLVSSAGSDGPGVPLDTHPDVGRSYWLRYLPSYRRCASWPPSPRSPSTSRACPNLDSLFSIPLLNDWTVYLSTVDTDRHRQPHPLATAQDLVQTPRTLALQWVG